MLEIFLVLALVIVLIWMVSSKEQFDTGAAKPSDITPASGIMNYVRLYEDFNWSGDSLLYEMTNTSNNMKFLKYAIKAPVKSIDINLPNDITGPLGEKASVELWNVRPYKGLESSQSDFYENTIYTTPDYLRQVTGNLVKVAEVHAGGSLKINKLPPIKKLLIVAKL